MKKQTTIYEPDRSIRKGYFSLFGELTGEILNNRWLTYQLFLRDFSAMYKQSVIGVLWVFILPIVNVATFVMLTQSGVLNAGEINAPYPVYAILGMSLWQIFSSGVVTCGTALTNAGEMITRINFSKKSLILATMGRPLISFLIQMAFVFLLCVYYGLIPHLEALALPIIVLLIMILTLGIGFAVAILNALVRDTGNILYIFLMLLMYLTPIFYARPNTGLLAALTHYNPMYYFIAAGRDLFLNGHIGEWTGLVISSLLSIMFFLVSITIFHLTETRIAERI